ncbi:MAG TPA: phytanoyl-CoA dioxygenase family protein [Planctomycetota bacterium]|nr:phytanoyl-CoA dioxygenase family protein [Planctomycetota bacterium]
MPISADERFLFDVAGFLHLRSALSPSELATYDAWIREAQDTDVKVLNAGDAEALKNQLNRPVSRIIDADPRFACFLDHPVVVPHLEEFVGENYRHIDNDLYFTHPGYKGGGWHRGVKVRHEGHVRDGKFTCPMVKVFYCMTDVGPGEGEFVIVPGSHRAHFEIPMDRVDLPGQHVFNNVKRGDIIIFDEGLLHNGRPNPSQKTRKTVIMNFGRHTAGVWKGYKPSEKTLEAVSARQRAILTNETLATWAEPA